MPKQPPASTAVPAGLVAKRPCTRGRRLTDWALVCRGERKSARGAGQKKAVPPPPPPPSPVPAPADVAAPDVAHFDFFDALHATGPLPHGPVVVPAVDLADLADLWPSDAPSLPELLPELAEVANLPELPALAALPEPLPAARCGSFTVRVVPQAVFEQRVAAELGPARRRGGLRLRLRHSGAGVSIACGAALRLDALERAERLERRTLSERLDEYAAARWGRVAGKGPY